MVPAKITSFWNTTPNLVWSSWEGMEVMGLPPMRMLPPSASYSRMSRAMRVDLPQPVAPMMPRVSPGFRRKEMSSTLGSFLP